VPNFEAKIRTGYKDVEGIVLDCYHSDLAADGSLWTNRAPAARVLRSGTHDGANNSATLVDTTAYWRANALVGLIAYNITDGSMGLVTANSSNAVTAALAGGGDNDWDTGDTYALVTPRFGNPYQDVVARRPAVTTPAGYTQATFDRTNSEFMNIPLAYDIIAGSWTAAFEYLTVAASGANNHPILVFPNWSIWRQNAAGNYKYRHGAVDVNGVGDMAAGAWVLGWTAAATAALYRNGSSVLAGSASNQEIAAADPAGYIAADTGAGGNFCDIILRAMAIWRRRMSPLEIDFVFRTISPEFDYAVQDRAAMSDPPGTWTDDTGATAQEVSRINPTTYAQHRFYMAQFPAGTQRRIQISASIDGLVVPDAELGAPPKLFEMKCIEHASAGHPAVYQDAGWSAIWDVEINTEGHYTFAVYREGSGTVVLHLDAENP
jgi:hypothetical protein